MQPLAQAIPHTVALLLRNSPTSPAKIAFAWKAVVGAGIGRVTRVHLEGHVLLVEVDTAAWRHEIARSSPLLLGRLQRLLGADVIREISVRA